MSCHLHSGQREESEVKVNSFFLFILPSQQGETECMKINFEKKSKFY